MTTVIYNTFASIINFKRRKRWIYFIILVMLVYMLFYWTSDGEPVFSLESRVKSGVKCKSKVYEISEILDDSAFLLERHSKQDLEDLFFDFLVTVKVQCRDQAHYGPREDGGWEVCMENFYEIKKPCLIYSFGIDHDFRFEKDIEEKLGCEVHAFDPSMEVIDHKYSSNGWYHNLGLGGENGHMVDGTWEVKTLEQIMKDYGHYYSKPIDYLKLDIEFSEWLALPEMIASGILSKVRQIGMEVHTPEIDSLKKPYSKCTWSQKQTVWHMLNTLKHLEREGFKLYYFTPNQRIEYLSKVSFKRRFCAFQVYFLNTKFRFPEHE